MKRSLAHFFLLLLLLLPATVGADWLAFKDGSTTETRGPWKVQGRRVVFTALSGTLSAVRLDEVDLPASEQLSKNAASDRALIELTDDPTLLSTGGKQVVSEKSYNWQKYPYRHIGSGENCVPSRLVGATSGVDWWLQIGIKLSKFRLIGLSWADVEHLKALVPDGMVCFEVDAKIPSRDPAGNIVGYARLADGRDVGLELLRSGAARLNDEAFSRRADYLAATQ